MALAAEILQAESIDQVRKAVAGRSLAEIREAVEPLAAEVLRMMRTDARRALAIADRAAVVAEASEDPRLEARTVWMRGHGLAGVLRNREAAECYEAAAHAYREIGDRLQEAKVSIGWINALMYLGEYAKALALGEKARTVFLRRGLFPEAARLETNLGSIHHRVERPVEALAQYDRALRTAKQVGDPDMLRVIQFNRANVLTNLGRMEAAEKLYRDVGREAREVGETRTAGFAEYSLGYLALLRGEYETAYKSLESSRTTFEELGDAHYLTLTLTDLAELFVEMNSFRRALSFGRRARSLAERHGIRLEAARSALFEAVACIGLGEASNAATFLADAERAFRLEGNEVSGSVCALYLAELERRAGRLPEAAALLAGAARVFASEGVVLREAAARTRLGFVELERGRAKAAAAEVQRARAAMRRVHAPWLLARIEHLSGKIAMEQGQLGVATRRLRRAVDRIEAIRGRIGIDEFRIGFAEDKAPVYADLVHVLLRRGRRECIAEAFEIVERARSRSLVDLLAGRLSGARDSAEPGVAKLLARLEKLRAELNWLSGFDPEPRKGRRDEARLSRSGAELERCEEEIADVVARLLSKDDALGALTAGETTTLAEVREGLAGATLVEYWVSEHGTVAFVIDGRDTRVVELEAGRAEIAELMSRLRFQMEKWGYGEDYVRPRDAVLRRSLDRQLARLAERLWTPLEIASERVVVVPHGPLHSLPFHALVGADGSPLVERHSFSWLPSASAKRYLTDEDGRPRVSPAQSRVLAVGVGDPSIPQVDEEVRRVRRTFRRGRVLSGPQATRARFLREARDADVVHVATHAVFREDDPFFSSLRLADGWMSLYDLYGMRLSGSLVCLSACQSGRNWIGAGDELVGLARGFLHAGARTLVVSLWPVQDDSTAQLMEAFYRHLR
ncbi:MAG: CHAT domain-containing protein, partial [Candidatus Eiseniibacteriota bacterium]